MPLACGSVTNQPRIERAQSPTTQGARGPDRLHRRGVLVPLAGARAGERAKTPAGAANAAGGDAALIARGEYLARAGDCVACHTLPAGKVFGGGRLMDTPFGTLFTPNISSDKETGIGKWTAEQFCHDDAHRQVERRLAALSRDAVHPPTRRSRAPTPMRSTPTCWRRRRREAAAEPPARTALSVQQAATADRLAHALFRQGEYQPDPKQSAKWNRGAYLVEGLGHCSMCHTAINALGGNVTSKEFEGGLIPLQNWYAPSLTSNKEAGLGDWSIEDIVGLLHAGVSNRGRRVRADGRSGLQQPAVPDRGGRARDGRVPERRCPRVRATPPAPPPSAAVAERRSMFSRRSARRCTTRSARSAMRHRGREASAFSAAREQPVDRDGLRRQSDPHGPERRLPARARRRIRCPTACRRSRSRSPDG